LQQDSNGVAHELSYAQRMKLYMIESAGKYLYGS